MSQKTSQIISYFKRYSINSNSIKS